MPTLPQLGPRLDVGIISHKLHGSARSLATNGGKRLFDTPRTDSLHFGTKLTIENNTKQYTSYKTESDVVFSVSFR